MQTTHEEPTMNALGKVLTVFVFLGSLVWLGFTVALFSTRADWKRAALDAEKAAQDTYKQAEANRQEALERRRQADAQLADSERTLRTIQKERDEYQGRYDTLLKTTKEVAQKNEDVQPLINELQQVNTTVQKTVDTLTKENRDLGAAREAAAQDAEKARNLANDKTLELRTTKAALDAQIERVRALAEKERSSGAVSDADFRGDVLAVSKENDIVVFSGGANAGVKAGRRYLVKRNVAPFYVGTVVVIDASDPQKSSGVFTPASGQKLGGQYVPKLGDTVSSN